MNFPLFIDTYCVIYLLSMGRLFFEGRKSSRMNSSKNVSDNDKILTETSQKTVKNSVKTRTTSEK